MKNFLLIVFISAFALTVQGQITYPKIISNVDSKFEDNLVVGDSVYAVKLVASSTTVGTSENAAIEANSTTAGVLIPRMTTTQRNAILEDGSTSTADSTAATGLLIFNTTTGAFNWFNGTAWVAIPAAGSGGSLTTSGAYAITLTATATTGVTLPTSGTLYGTATGSITSAELSTSLTNETGSGVAVFATSPTLVTPALGVATATSINGATISSTTGTLTLANGSTLATSGGNSITLTSTGATNVTLPTSGTLVNDAVTSLSSLASIGTLTALDVNADVIRLRTAKTPSASNDTGTQGQIAWDASYIYICTATNTWERVAIATW